MSARRGVEQRVEDRPIGDRVAAVAHGLGLAVRRRDAPGVEVVAPDDDRRADRAVAHQVVEREPGPRAIAVTEPADACRQPLKRNAFARETQPARQRGVGGKQLEQLLVAARDVGRIARERGEPKRPGAAAKERPDEGRHEPRKREGAGEARPLRLRANVVAVVEHHGARVEVANHGGDVRAAALQRASLILVRIAVTQLGGSFEREAGGNVAVEQVVRRRLIGHGVGTKTEVVEARELLGRVAFVTHREGLARRLGAVHLAQRLLARVSDAVEVTQVAPPLQARPVHVDHQGDAAVHGDRQRLRAAHAADSGRQRDAALERAAEVLARQLGKGLVRSLNDALRADVDPRAGRHLPVHRQAFRLELAEDAPVRPLPDQVRVGDEDARGARVGLEDRDRLAALNDQRLVAAQAAERTNDGVERLPRPRRAAVAAVNDQVLRAFGDVGIEVVHQHPQRGFLRPAQARNFGAARRPNGSAAGDDAHVRRNSRKRSRRPLPSRPSTAVRLE